MTWSEVQAVRVVQDWRWLRLVVGPVWYCGSTRCTTVPRRKGGLAAGWVLVIKAVSEDGEGEMGEVGEVSEVSEVSELVGRCLCLADRRSSRHMGQDPPQGCRRTKRVSELSFSAIEQAGRWAGRMQLGTVDPPKHSYSYVHTKYE